MQSSSSSRTSGRPMPPTTILFLAANPAQLQPLQLGEECRAIEERIRSATFRDQIRFRPRWAAHLDDLMQALNEHSPSVVHFCGHGNGESGLSFQSENGCAMSINADGIARVMEAAGTSVAVVVLNACYSEVQAQALASLVPCVIGASNAVRDGEAVNYAAAFYGALAYGKSVASAHRQGITAVWLHSNSGLGGPARDAEMSEMCTPAFRLLTRPGTDAESIYITGGRHPSSRCQIVIKATVAECTGDVLARITDELRELTDDLALEIKYLEEGSVRLTVALAPEATRKLVALKATGRLDSIGGFEVCNVIELAAAQIEAQVAAEQRRVATNQEADPPRVRSATGGESIAKSDMDTAELEKPFTDAEPILLQTARRLCASDADAYGLVRDAFTRAMQHPSSLVAPITTASLHSVMMQLFVDRCRTAAKPLPVADAIEVVPTPTGGSQLAQPLTVNNKQELRRTREGGEPHTVATPGLQIDGPDRPRSLESTARVKVMVVDDDLDVAQNIARRLGSNGLDVELATDPRSVLARLDAGEGDSWDVVLLDLGLPGVSGFDVLRRFREANSLASVVILTGDGSADAATTCMRAGAFYYLTKPFRLYELLSIVESAARYSMLRRELAGARQVLDDASDQLLVGTSPAMRKLRAAVDRLASQEVSILIRGETGTGKELVARALHVRGARRKRLFVPLNCGAIPESLIDSELFGHARGAFTGATGHPGVFVEADGGTLFLDEIGEMPMAVQARLLRVLQDGAVRRVGGSGVRSVDVRVIAATNADLPAAVKQHRFREDLFYRLNVLVLNVPPLRERLEDLPVLAAHFLRKHGGSTPRILSPEALDAMMMYTWPGNVRELENAIIHAIALYQGGVIIPESLPVAVAMRAASRIEPPENLLPLTEAKRRASAMFEKDYLMLAMEHAAGSVSEAARLMGLDRTEFQRLLKRHGIEV